MPHDTAATLRVSGSSVIAPAAISLSTAMRSATQAPEIAAVRVPPSAWITSQSSVIWRSPSFLRSVTARKDRPIRRWISCVRPLCLPLAASRLPRVCVARGSIEYSAVTQPSPLPRSQGGRRSSTLAVQITLVCPNDTSTDPSACLVKWGSKLMARISSGARPEGRIQFSSSSEPSALSLSKGRPYFVRRRKEGRCFDKLGTSGF